MNNVLIKRIKQGALCPTKMSAGSVAYDVFLPEDVYVKPGRNKIPLGIAIEMPLGIEAKIEPRSGFSAKGLLDCNGERFDADVLVGKIDYDYRGEISVIIKSNEKFQRKVTAGTRIAQMTFYRVEEVRFKETDELTNTTRGNGGFGSTGTGA